MVAFAPGLVVLVRFPFSDLSSSSCVLPSYWRMQVVRSVVAENTRRASMGDLARVTKKAPA